MKNYIIVGDNNFWYSTTGLITEEVLKQTIEEIKDYIKINNEEEEPTTLYVYETSEETSLTINL